MRARNLRTGGPARSGTGGGAGGSVSEAAAALARARLFAGLEPTVVERLAAELRRRRFRRGEVIFHLGDPGDALFLVVSGAVKICLPTEEGDEAILATIHPGEAFGELALLDGAPRSASAVAMLPTEVLVLARPHFEALVEGEPAIRWALLRTLAAEIRRLTEQVAELHFLDIPGRLAARLLRLAGEAGARQPDGTIRLDGPITQGELAAMIGSTRQTVNRFLGDFVAAGLLRLERDAIVILDERGLAEAASR
ncbi:MAG TPA: Crp/Fnr family transcriptional regulator [Candidatus Binatia bacterium]|nr:Crp/Fnr family transcriptional regulator [Candidatus Binatia bacterium]